MYGLLLDSIQKFLREKYGEHYWVVIRRRAKLSNHWFVTHEVYSDSVMSDLVDAAASTLGEQRDHVMQMFGEYFVQNIGRYGYARLLRVLGRDMRDFLNGLDDLHEYLRFSYPKMRPPSFFCEKETPQGMVMHYTTKRRGYLPYVVGQLHAVGRIYNKDLNISIMRENHNSEGVHVVLELKFDNIEFVKTRRPSAIFENLQLSGPAFISIFPFCIAFNKEMEIITVGSKMDEVLPGLRGRRLDFVFTHRRPRHVLLKWDSIIMHTNCSFELISIETVTRPQQLGMGKNSPSMKYSESSPNLKLKGQMMLLTTSDHLLFLCSPIMDSPESLYQSGIFINDLAMHDSTREYILAGSQQNPELTIALNQEKIRTKQLEDSIQKTDELIYQMIPKQIADKLRNGETPLNTCKLWTSVSILFSDIVSFTPMCMRLRPMEVVCVLNAMYVAFDQLCEKHHVYKVQTIGDAYMALAGAPVTTPHHAEYMTDFAFSIIEAIGKIHDPSTQEPLQIRVGIHSGTVVAGVVGSRIYRYDVFGDSVNTAARMEATGLPMKIHISKATADLLQGTEFVVQERGEFEVKGKGTMKTYWVLEKKRSTSSTIEEPLNPLQKKKAESNFPSGRKMRIDSADIREIVESNFKQTSKYSPPIPRAEVKDYSINDHTPKLPHILPTPRASLSPDAWPELEQAMQGMNQEEEEEEEEETVPNLNNTRLSTVSLVPGILNSHKGESMDLGDPRYSSSTLLTLPFNVPDELKSLATENMATIKEFERIAEENAQTARNLANWAHYVSNLIQQQQQKTSEATPSSSKEAPKTRRATVANIPQGRRATVATVPVHNLHTIVETNPSPKPIELKHRDSSVDFEDTVTSSKNHARDGNSNCNIL